MNQSPNLEESNIEAEMRDEMRAHFANTRIMRFNFRIGGYGTFQMPVKAISGHPASHPSDAALAALSCAGRVAVGTTLPAAAFPGIQEWTRDALMDLSEQQLDDLQWFYNEAFVGANIKERRFSFAFFIGLERQVI